MSWATPITLVVLIGVVLLHWHTDRRYRGVSEPTLLAVAFALAMTTVVVTIEVAR